MSVSSGQTVKPPPELPKGNSSIFRGISENLSFHASPEAFIASRVQQLQNDDPSILSSRAPVRAKILNRNVAVISSYHQIQSILHSANPDNEQPTYIASKAYDELMSQFFPPPNLLLSDGCPHMRMRQVWDDQMHILHSSSTKGLESLVSSFCKTSIPLNQEIDLYELMKTLAWQILLSAFLNLSLESGPQLFREFQTLQEDLLRGQFSLMPISINTRIWQSPRSKGIAARKKLQDLILQRLQDLRHRAVVNDEAASNDQKKSLNTTGLPFSLAQEDKYLEEVRDHVLMMTSSLATKGLASLLTAFLLNLFLFDRGGVKIVDELKSMSHADQNDHQSKFLRSVYLETERLSPPIVGIMRRVTTESVVSSHGEDSDTLIPSGWDVWMYFVGGNRDPAVFGTNCMDFDPTRYISDDVPEPLGFGAGPKSCLGKQFVRDCALLTARCCLASGLRIDGEISRPGLRAWLGWETASPEQWAADTKQLPTQRPAAPILVRFAKG